MGRVVAAARETSARLLRLLSLLQGGRNWTGAKLADRLEVSAAAYTVSVPPDRPGPTVDPALLSTLAALCRDRERLRFDYRDQSGASSVRLVEPYKLVNWGRRWYLVAWDVDRHDWRTFRADRIQPRTPTGPRFAPRQPPEADLAAYVARRVSAAAWRYRARVTVHAPAEVIAERINPAVGTVEALDEHSCVLDTGADTIDTLAVYLGLLGADFTVTGPPELVDYVRTLSARYGRAAGPRAGPVAGDLR